jgi:hypothetical protein
MVAPRAAGTAEANAPYGLPPPFLMAIHNVQLTVQLQPFVLYRIANVRRR